jgi:type I restriction enzyme, S subunit
MRFRINESFVDANFIEVLLRSSVVRNYYKSSAAGSSSTMVKINKSIVENTPLILPPTSQQKKIAKILSAWDKAIEKMEVLIVAKKKLKKALMQQLLTGKIRFSGFSDEWKKTRLKRIIREEKSRNKNGVITRVLSVTNRSGFVLPKDQFSRQVASDDLSNYKIVRQGQFGYNPSRINVGSFARLDSYDEGVLSPMYIIFSINEKSLDSDFFNNWMGSHEAKQRITSSTQGTVRDSVGFDALGSFPIILPSLDEQQKIAALLSAADKEIATNQKLLAALKRQKSGLQQQLLTGKRRVQLDKDVKNVSI